MLDLRFALYVKPLRRIPWFYGVWHPYKHVCRIIWRTFFPLFAYISGPVFEAGACIYNLPKLIVIEKPLLALFLVAEIYGHGCGYKVPCLREVPTK